jgi:hypothetical protein
MSCSTDRSLVHWDLQVARWGCEVHGKNMGKTNQERIGYTETLQKNNEKHV